MWSQNLLPSKLLRYGKFFFLHADGVSMWRRWQNVCPLYSFFFALCVPVMSCVYMCPYKSLHCGISSWGFITVLFPSPLTVNITDPVLSGVRWVRLWVCPEPSDGDGDGEGSRSPVWAGGGSRWGRWSHGTVLFSLQETQTNTPLAVRCVLQAGTGRLRTVGCLGVAQVLFIQPCGERNDVSVQQHVIITAEVS